jgi:c-di-GMP-related signal transduction protein
MSFLLARQPIFDHYLNVYAYELLYRNHDAGSIKHTDGEVATSSVLVNALLTSQADVYTGSVPAFVNFTDQLILDEIPHILNPERIVVEILENAHVSQSLIDAVDALREKGFKVAYDDFIYSETHSGLVDHVDILKVDFMDNTESDVEAIVKKYHRPGLRLLAEKVETKADFHRAVKLGFDLFQGFFFARPVVVEGVDLKGFNASLMRVVGAMQKTEPDFKEIAQIVEKDISLTYKLLKMVNSAAFYKRQTIQNVQQALALLGLKELKKWVYLLVLREHSTDKPSELLKLSLIRAKHAEAVSMLVGHKKNASEAFMTGLLSLLDTMMDNTMENIVKELPLDQTIREALLGQDNELSKVLKLVLSYERGEWDQFYSLAAALSVDPLLMPNMYFDALEWANEVAASIDL